MNFFTLHNITLFLPEKSMSTLGNIFREHKLRELLVKGISKYWIDETNTIIFRLSGLINTVAVYVRFDGKYQITTGEEINDSLRESLFLDPIIYLEACEIGYYISVIMEKLTSYPEGTPRHKIKSELRVYLENEF